MGTVDTACRRRRFLLCSQRRRWAPVSLLVVVLVFLTRASSEPLLLLLQRRGWGVGVPSSHRAPAHQPTVIRRRGRYVRSVWRRELTGCTVKFFHRAPWSTGLLSPEREYARGVRCFLRRLRLPTNSRTDVDVMYVMSDAGTSSSSRVGGRVDCKARYATAAKYDLQDFLPVLVLGRHQAGRAVTVASGEHNRRWALHHRNVRMGWA